MIIKYKNKLYRPTQIRRLINELTQDYWSVGLYFTCYGNQIKAELRKYNKDDTETVYCAYDCESPFTALGKAMKDMGLIEQ